MHSFQAFSSRVLTKNSANLVIFPRISANLKCDFHPGPYWDSSPHCSQWFLRGLHRRAPLPGLGRRIPVVVFVSLRHKSESTRSNAPTLPTRHLADSRGSYTVNIPTRSLHTSLARHTCEIVSSLLRHRFPCSYPIPPTRPRFLFSTNSSRMHIEGTNCYYFFLEYYYFCYCTLSVIQN